MLKVDQVSNLGAARIRIRSLMAALKEQREELAQRALPAGCARSRPRAWSPPTVPRARSQGRARPRARLPRVRLSAAFKKVRYTKEMQDAGYTILAPQMSPIHFELVEELLLRTRAQRRAAALR